MPDDIDSILLKQAIREFESIKNGVTVLPYSDDSVALQAIKEKSGRNLDNLPDGKRIYDAVSAMLEIEAIRKSVEISSGKTYETKPKKATNYNHDCVTIDDIPKTPHAKCDNFVRSLFK